MAKSRTWTETELLDLVRTSAGILEHNERIRDLRRERTNAAIDPCAVCERGESCQLKDVFPEVVECPSYMTHLIAQASARPLEDDYLSPAGLSHSFSPETDEDLLAHIVEPLRCDGNIQTFRINAGHYLPSMILSRLDHLLRRTGKTGGQAAGGLSDGAVWGYAPFEFDGSHIYVRVDLGFPRERILAEAAAELGRLIRVGIVRPIFRGRENWHLYVMARELRLDGYSAVEIARKVELEYGIVEDPETVKKWTARGHELFTEIAGIEKPSGKGTASFQRYFDEKLRARTEDPSETAAKIQAIEIALRDPKNAKNRELLEDELRYLRGETA